MYPTKLGLIPFCLLLMFNRTINSATEVGTMHMWERGSVSCSVLESSGRERHRLRVHPALQNNDSLEV